MLCDCCLETPNNLAVRFGVKWERACSGAWMAAPWPWVASLEEFSVAFSVLTFDTDMRKCEWGSHILQHLGVTTAVILASSWKSMGMWWDWPEGAQIQDSWK